MSTNVNSGFHCNGTFPIDSKLIMSASEMKAIDCDDPFFCICSDNGNMYAYDKSHDVDPVYGKFIKHQNCQLRH